MPRGCGWNTSRRSAPSARCSICARTRFWLSTVRADAFALLEGKDALTDYQFGRNAIHYLFCSRCGVKPFGKGHLDALGGDFYAVNVGCLDDASAEELAAAPVQFQDGRNNHWEAPPRETRHL